MGEVPPIPDLTAYTVIVAEQRERSYGRPGPFTWHPVFLHKVSQGRNDADWTTEFHKAFRFHREYHGKEPLYLLIERLTHRPESLPAWVRNIRRLTITSTAAPAPR